MFNSLFKKKSKTKQKKKKQATLASILSSTPPYSSRPIFWTSLFQLLSTKYIFHSLLHTLLSGYSLLHPYQTALVKVSITYPHEGLEGAQWNP